MLVGRLVVPDCVFRCFQLNFRNSNMCTDEKALLTITTLIEFVVFNLYSGPYAAMPSFKYFSNIFNWREFEGQ